jgi:purine-cytosine permease-like protein
MSYTGGEYLLGGFWSTWTLSVMFFAIVTFTYAFWVNDWTRYISRELWSDRTTMWAAGMGSFIGLSIPTVFGAFTAVAIAETGLSYVPGIVAVSSTWYLVPLVFIGVVGSLGQGTVDIYSTGLDFSSIFPWLSRVAATVVLSVLGLIFVFLGTIVWDAEAAVTAFIALLGVFAAAWIAVVLVGHFQRRGHYDADALQVFNRGERGGIYWFWHGLNPQACIAWTAGSIVGLLFLYTSLYTGPWSGLANGLDLSWISAMTVAGVAYMVLTRVFPEAAEVYGVDAELPPNADMDLGLAKVSEVPD